MDQKRIQEILDQQRADSLLHQKSKASIICSIASQERLSNPLWREKYYENPEWLDPVKKKRAESLRTQEASKKLSEGQKRRYQDPSEREKTSRASKNSFSQNPERRERLSKSSKLVWSNEELRKQSSNSHKKQWEDPNKRSQLSDSMKEVRKYPIMTPDGEFASTQEAADFYKLSRATILYRLGKYPDQYFYTGKKPHSNKKKI
jgi:hypothetical protein